MKTTDLRKTHLFEAQQAVCQIVNPVIESSKIDLFTYRRIYQNNQAVALTTFPESLEAVIKQQLCPNYEMMDAIISHRNRVSYLDNHIYYLTEKENSKAYQLASQSFGLYNNLVLIDKRDDFFEFFCFCSRIAYNLTDYYFDHWDKLVRIKHLFLDKGEPLIKKAYQEKLIIGGPGHLEGRSQLDQHLKEIPISRYYLLFHNQRIKITQRELDCLKLLAQGNSYKQIGDILSISARTVETYLESLKKKLQVYSRSQLVDAYLSSDLSFL